MKNITIDKIELRAAENGDKYLVGFIPFNMRSNDLGGFKEVISTTAFNKTLADGYNVRALLDHDSSKLLADVKSQTLVLARNDEGLNVEVKLPHTTYALDAFELMERGIGGSMSFGFIPIKTEENRSAKERILKEVALKEVSFLLSKDPAYPATMASTLLRSVDEDLGKIDVEKLDDDAKAILLEIKQKIDGLYGEKPVELKTAPVVENTPAPVETQSVDDEKEKTKLLLELEEII